MRRTVLMVAAGLVLLSACGGKEQSSAPASAIPSTEASSAASLSGSASPAGTSGCAAPVEVQPYPGKETLDSTHVDETLAPSLDSYPSVPPASGPHASSTLPAGAYAESPSPYEVIHSLEHGAVAIWYDPAKIDATAASVAGQQWAGDHVLVAPFEGAAMASPITLVAWHRSMACESFDTAAITDFLTRFRAGGTPTTTYEGDAPEPGLPI